MPLTPIVTITPTRIATETSGSTQVDYNGVIFTYEPVLFSTPQMGQVAETAVNEPTCFYAGDGWQDISSEHVNFRVAREWQPLALELGGGSVLADWQLGIPGVESDQFIGFSGVIFDDLKPTDVISEDELLIGGRPGFKWVRQGEGYISYNYYTTPQTRPKRPEQPTSVCMSP